MHACATQQQQQQHLHSCRGGEVALVLLLIDTKSVNTSDVSRFITLLLLLLLTGAARIFIGILRFLLWFLLRLLGHKCKADKLPRAKSLVGLRVGDEFTCVDEDPLHP